MIRYAECDLSMSKNSVNLKFLISGKVFARSFNLSKKQRKGFTSTSRRNVYNSSELETLYNVVDHVLQTQPLRYTDSQLNLISSDLSKYLDEIFVLYTVARKNLQQLHNSVVLNSRRYFVTYTNNEYTGQYISLSRISNVSENTFTLMYERKIDSSFVGINQFVKNINDLYSAHKPASINQLEIQNMCNTAYDKTDTPNVAQPIHPTRILPMGDFRVTLTQIVNKKYKVSVIYNTDGFSRIAISIDEGIIAQSNLIDGCIKSSVLFDIVDNITSIMKSEKYSNLNNLIDCAYNTHMYGFHWDICVTPTTVCINLSKLGSSEIADYVINYDDADEANEIKNALTNIVHDIKSDNYTNLSISYVKKVIVNLYNKLIEREDLVNQIKYKLMDLSNTELKELSGKLK